MTLFLFNWIGYRWVAQYMEATADAQMDGELDDNNYDESQLVSVKVPITQLSYYSNSKEFENIRGHIEIGGVQYKYVKRRIYNDSLEVLCIPDAMAIKLQAVKNEFFQFANDLHHTGTGQNKKQSANAESYKHFTTDYYPIFSLPLLESACRILTNQHSGGGFLRIYSIYSRVPERPPQQG